MTLEELNTIYTETLGSVTIAQNLDFTAANPASVDADLVTSVATAKTVTSGTIGAFVSVPVTAVDFQTVSTTDEITDESLNRTARTLRDDINLKLSAFSTNLNSSVNGLRADVANSVNTLTTDINLKLAAIKDEQDTQVSAVNSVIQGLESQLNTQISALKTAEAQQSSDIAAKINLIAGEIAANVAKVKNIADNAQAKIAALDTVYGTDAQLASQVTNVNDFINTLRGTDMSFVQAVDGTIDEVNSLKRIQTKEVLVAAGSGVYNFTTLAEGFGEFLNAGDYTVDVQEIGNYKVRASVENKTAAGFDIRVISHGVHFVPQPIDCSVTPIKVVVKVEHNKANPMTFNVDTLNASFITNGAGTDTNAVGAMVLDVSTLELAVSASAPVVAYGSSGTITAVSSNNLIATASVVGTKITVTGVAAGTATIAISDNYMTRTVSVTVA